MSDISKVSVKKAVKTITDKYRKGLEKKDSRKRRKHPHSPAGGEKGKESRRRPAAAVMAGPAAEGKLPDKKVHTLKGGGSIKNVQIEYPLTPRVPQPRERVYAWASIQWDPVSNALMYYIREPELSSEDQEQVSRVKDIIEEKLDIKFDALHKDAAVAYLKEAIDDIIVQFGVKLTPEQREAYEYFILRDFIGLGKVQPIFNDPNIEDISCDGMNIPLFVYHKDPKFGSLKTNVSFTDTDELDGFVMKLAQRCNKSISVSEPLLDGALPDGSRVQATLATDVAKRGSNFTIRKFSEEPLTPIHLIDSNTADSSMMAYLWYLIEHNRSVLVSGSTASGKTSLLNALSLFIRPSMKIISIEDTPELRLPHVHWVPEISRESFDSSQDIREKGQVTMFDLLKGALRQRPDYIIVGEVRGKEAYILFQAMATGHPGLATIHADSIEKVIDRLVTKPIELPASLLETLDAILFTKRLKYRDRYVRRISDIWEIHGFDAASNKLNKAASFAWKASSDRFETPEKSLMLGKIAEAEGTTLPELNLEIRQRAKVLEWMKTMGFKNYKQFSKVMNQYYTDPDVVMEWIEKS